MKRLTEKELNLLLDDEAYSFGQFSEGVPSDPDAPGGGEGE